MTKRQETDPATTARILAQLPAVVWTTDRELVFTLSRGAGLAALGLAPDQVVGVRLVDFFGGAGPENPGLQAHAEALAGRASHFDLSFGGRTWHAFVEPLRDDAGDIVGTVGSAQDITDLRRAESALASSEERFRRFFEESPDAILWADPATGTVMAANPAAERLFGRPASELVGAHQTTLHPPGEAERYAAGFGEHAKGMGSVLVHGEALRSDGRRVPVSIRGTVIEIGGRPLLQGLFRDESAATEAEAALRASEEKYRRLIESLRQGYFFYRHDSTGVFDYISPSIEEVLGHTPEDFQKHYTKFLVDGPGRQAVIDRTEAGLRGERQPAYELEIYRKDGSVCILEVLEAPVFDAEGNVRSVEGIAHDVTSRHRAESELRENRRMLETLLANLPGIAYRCRNDPDWTMEFVSAACLRLTGWSAEELAGPREPCWADLILPADRPLVWDAVQQAVSARRPFELHYRIRTRDGKEKWVWEQGRGIFDDAGSLLFLEGYITDVTDLRRTADALAASERRLLEILEKITDCVYSIRVGDDAMHAEVEYVGPQITRITGVPTQRFLDDPSLWSRLLHPDDRPAVEAVTARLVEAPCRERREYRLLSEETGSWRWVADLVESYADATGRVRKLVGVARDVTERRAADEALRRSQRELANYHDLMTHDLSNFSMKLLGLLEVLLSETAGPLTDAQVELLRKANRQALELERLAANARLLSRIDEVGRLAPVVSRPLADLVAEAVSAARAIHFDRDVKPVVEIAPGAGNLAIPFLENVLLNLVDNAIRYSPREQGARIAVSAAPGDSGRVVLLTILGGRLADPSFVDRMFDRYVRGPKSSGSGLGLAAAREIVRAAGGSIAGRAVEQEDGSLCEIRLALPREV